MKKLTKKSKLAQKLANDNAKGAQIGIIEELFYDLYPNRWEIYKVNFFRGIAFGFGSFIGATVIILATIWFLPSSLVSQLVLRLTVLTISNLSNQKYLAL